MKCFTGCILKKAAICTSVVLFVLMAAGCTKGGREADLSVLEKLASLREWCVISVPYAAFKQTPSSAADVINHGRRSDIVEITGKKYITESKQTVLWYQFDKGWLPESSVIVYENKLKAETAARSMNE